MTRQKEKLTDGKYERPLPVHSWNSNHVLGRIMLFELSRHSDHHYLASRKYQVLQHHDNAPQLPTASTNGITGTWNPTTISTTPGPSGTTSSISTLSHNMWKDTTSSASPNRNRKTSLPRRQRQRPHHLHLAGGSHLGRRLASVFAATAPSVRRLSAG